MTRILPLAFLFAFSLDAIAADWAQWRGSRRDGGTAEAVEPWTDAPKEVWRIKIGAGHSSPVVADGKVFAHARITGKDREELVCVDAASGKVLWRSAYDRAPYFSVLNTGPQATPTVSGNRVYTFGITGVLACFDTADGKILWQVDAFKKLGAELPRFGVCCSPLVVGNRVIVAVGGKGSSVAAFDSENGDIAWQALDEAASTSSPVLFVGGPSARKLPSVVVMTTLRIVGLNPLDGAVAWEFALPYQPSGTAPTPVVAGDRVVTSTMTNGTTAIRIASGEKPTAEKLWQAKDVSGYFSSGAVAGERAFVVTNVLKPVPRADLACLDMQTGKELWKKEGVGYFHFSPIRTANGKLLVLSDMGQLTLMDAAASEYRELCTAKVCGGNLVAPAYSNGKLFARDDEGLVCIQVNNSHR